MNVKLLISSILMICVLFATVGCEEEELVTKPPQTQISPSGEAVVGEPEAVVSAESKSAIAGAPGSVVEPAVVKEPVAKIAEPNVTAAPKPLVADAGQIADNEKLAKIKVDERLYDFGKVGPGTKNRCQFKFQNIGEGILRISKVKTTCGCTVPELAKKEYAPGESGTINVTYSSPKRSGSTTKHLYIQSNDKGEPRLKLSIKAEIVMKVEYEPKKLNLSLKKPNAGCPAITLKSSDDVPFSIKQFRSRPNVITADVNSSVEALEFVIEPKVDTEKLRGGSSGRINITLSREDAKSISIPFTVLEEFKVKPPTIIILDAQREKSTRKDLWVLNNYNEPFEVESVSSLNGLVKVLKQEKLDNRFRFELSITPPGDDTNKFFTDELYIQIKGGEKLVVKCRGFYRKPKTTP